MIIGRPDPLEYDARYDKYVKLVVEDDLLGAMNDQIATTEKLLKSIRNENIDRSFAKGEWTPREILGHIIDTERIFGFRFLCFARGDNVSLERADQDLYVRNAKFAIYEFYKLIEEFNLVRRSHISLLNNLPTESWARTGKVGGAPISVRAIAYLMLGHERHHLITIRDHYL